MEQLIGQHKEQNCLWENSEEWNEHKAETFSQGKGKGVRDWTVNKVQDVEKGK